MKTISFILLCAFFMLTHNSYATDIGFHVRIWKNTVTPGNYLGSFIGATDNDNPYAIAANNLGAICPGDQLIIKNIISKDGLQHNFIGSGSFGKATIALSSSTGHFVPLNVFGVVCSLSCPAAIPTALNWNWGSTVTFTVPPYGSTTPYLTIMTGIGNETPNPNCGPRWIHIPMSLAPTTTIDDQIICSGDILNLSLDPDFTYSNWSPGGAISPDGTALNATQTYSVDITHPATGCTRTESFTIKVSNPDPNPFTDSESLCFAESGFTLKKDWYEGLVGSTAPLKLVIDGVVIADNDADIMNFPHIINGANYGSGVINVEYTYEDYDLGITCTKTYTITIHPEILSDIEDSYAVCDENFTSICALTGTIQIGVTYKWQEADGFGVLATTPCFTPTAYGDYCLTLTDAFGCKLKKCFTVYDPGVGIDGPKDVIFCSLTEHPIGILGWLTDPFVGAPATFNWTYTNDAGTTVSIANVAPYYQIPNLGTGTYTVVVATTGGCTETFTFAVTDLLQIYTNHANAAFSFNPLGGNNVACLPTIAMGGMTEEWTVEDQYGTSITTIPYLSGVRFSYTIGVEYTVTFKRTSGGQWCQVFTNQFTWLDNSIRTGGNGSGGGNGSNNRIDVSNTGMTTSAPAEVQAFPNPTTGLVHLKLHNFTSTQTTIQVMNTLGAIVLEKEVQEISTLELDLSKQSSGIYMIRVINGTDELTQKVIKE